MIASIQFISSYAGSNVTAVLGSSINFTWAFKGDFDFIHFGFMTSQNQQNVNDQLVSITNDGTVTVKPLIAGRMNGSWNGQNNPGLVTFTLSSIQMQDSRLYGCRIVPSSIVADDVFDSVNLVVVGKHCYYFG